MMYLPYVLHQLTDLCIGLNTLASTLPNRADATEHHVRLRRAIRNRPPQLRSIRAETDTNRSGDRQEHAGRIPRQASDLLSVEGGTRPIPEGRPWRGAQERLPQHQGCQGKFERWWWWQRGGRLLCDIMTDKRGPSAEVGWVSTYEHHNRKVGSGRRLDKRREGDMGQPPQSSGCL